MGKTGRPFTLYTRPRKRGKPVHYVRYKKPGGGWTISQSTGQTSEGAAESYALDQSKTGAVVPDVGDVPTFAQWAVDFWDTGGRYDRARRVRGYVLSPTYLRIAELTVRKHLSPAFDRLKLTDLSSELLENHFLKVFEAGKLTARTVNSIVSLFRAMLREGGVVKVVGVWHGPGSGRLLVRPGEGRVARLPVASAAVLDPPGDDAPLRVDGAIGARACSAGPAYEVRTPRKSTPSASRSPSSSCAERP